MKRQHYVSLVLITSMAIVGFSDCEGKCKTDADCEVGEICVWGPHSHHYGMCEVPVDEGRVFILSEFVRGGELGNGGGDAFCQAEADAAGLDGAFVAWLSDSTSNARDRVEDRTYVRTDGVVVANDLADLTDGSIENPIITLADGSQLPDLPTPQAWTGTLADGTASGFDCDDWTNSDVSIATIGLTSGLDQGWTAGAAGQCGLPFVRIYCFEVEAAACVADPSSCDDGDPCTTDSCDPVTGCSNELIQCDAGEVCVGEDVDADGDLDPICVVDDNLPEE